MSEDERFHFPRPDLAAALSARCNPNPLMGALSGIHLAAPRRTGKSTFLHRDLVPALIDAGKLPIYIDFWADRGQDPAILLRKALARIIDELRGQAGRTLDRSRIRRISILGVGVGLADPEPFDGTITEALLAIGRMAARDVVLIIDEAQHATASEAGMNAMFALKAARDAMNLGESDESLYLILTGSNRDRLASLVLGHKAPFFGGSVNDFPVLGDGFPDALTERLNMSRSGHQLDEADMREAFVMLSHRPELLMSAVQAEIFDADMAGRAPDVTTQARAVRDIAWAEAASAFDELTPLQQWILEEVAARGRDFSAYAKDTMNRLNQDFGEDAVSRSTVQKAITALKDKGLIWQPGPGQYALEDSDMGLWLKERAQKED